jgi:general secretion pathway protein A
MYEQHFNFTAKPFQLIPDPEFFFGSRGHKRAMAYLNYGLHQAEGFIVITGDVGAGKTTLVRNVLAKISDQEIVAAQLVSSQLDENDLLRAVANGFGLDVHNVSKADILAKLAGYFDALMRDGRRALLVVDEAQNLTPRAIEELRMLSNFQSGSRSLLQSFLVGQPEFREVMQRPEMKQLKQRVIASFHLGPLDKAETRQYVEHRLTKVGWVGNPRFEDSAFDKIAENSGGIPRRINTLCDRLLLAAFLSEQNVINEALVDEISTEILDELSAIQIRSTPSSGSAWQDQASAQSGFGAISSGKSVEQQLDRIERSIQTLQSQMQALIAVSTSQARLTSQQSS